MPPTIEEKGVISAAADRPAGEGAACFTAVRRLAGGALVACFQVGPTKHAATSTIALYRSADDGRSWRRVPARFATAFEGVPGSLGSGELVEAGPGRLLLFATWFDRTDPHRPLFNPATEGILRARQLVAESADGGMTWSGWREVPTPGLTGTAGTGPCLAWADGTVAYPFESFKEYDDPSPPVHAAWLAVSRDGGRTFAPPVRVARDPADRVYYWDQRLCPGPRPGAFAGLFWTHDRTDGRDLNVHVLRTTLAELAGGHPPRPRATPVRGQIAAPLWLADGSLLMFVVDRGRPGTLALWRSPDGGLTWPESVVVHTQEERAAVANAEYTGGVDFAAYWEDMGKWSFGHPALADLGGGRVLAAYYAGTPGALDIRWARVRV